MILARQGDVIEVHPRGFLNDVAGNECHQPKAHDIHAVDPAQVMAGEPGIEIWSGTAEDRHGE
ncbi:hypothetical protein D3C79_1049830 [compost metagenome]